jgi:hypothetical protein
MPSTDPPSDEFADLLSRIRAGDQAAECQVFEQYLHRLTALAQSRLAARLSARIDPEDVVMSAYRSFFIAAREGPLSR